MSNDLMRTVEWKDGKVVMVDQSKLPGELVFVEYDRYEQVADAIKTLVVRGAPAIGVSGAFGMALAAQQSDANSKKDIIVDLENAKNVLQKTRPTAINLKWGLEKIMDVACKADGDANSVRDNIVREAKQMAEDDIAINKMMGKNGAVLFGKEDTVMTHCNAGALATVAYGTALGVIRAVREDGKKIKVIATETRPVQQGSRLTAFELQHDGFDVSLIPDTAVGYAMSQGLVDRVIVCRSHTADGSCFAFSKSIISFFELASLCCAASAMPKAPETPIAGAPRTTRVFIEICHLLVSVIFYKDKLTWKLALINHYHFAIFPFNCPHKII